MLSGCSLIHLPGQSSGGGISIPGVGSVGSGKLPKDFPSEVPVAKGEIISGISAGSGDKEGWNVSIKVSGGRNSWLTFEKKAVLARASSASDSARCRSAS